MPGITADLQIADTRVRRGGGKLFAVPYDAAKEPYCDHASLDTAYSTGTNLSTYGAAAAANYVNVPFGSSGALDVNIFAASPETNKAFSALSSGDFTLSGALAGAHAAGTLVKKYSANDYALADWKCLGALGGTTFRDRQGKEYTYDEENIKRAVHLGERDIALVTTLLQTGKAEFDWVFDEGRGKEFALKYVKEMGSLGKLVLAVRKAVLVTEAEVPFTRDADSVIAVTFEVITVGTYRPHERYQG